MNSIIRYLTNKGTEYLRTYLHLPAEIVPSTYKRTVRSEMPRVRSTAGPRTEGSKPQEDRASYRRAPGASGGQDKKGDVGPGASDVEFVILCLKKGHSNLLTNVLFLAWRIWTWIPASIGHSLTFIREYIANKCKVQKKCSFFPKF